MNPVKVLYYYSSAQVDTGSPRAMLRMIDSLNRDEFRPAFMASGAGSLIDELRSRNVEIIEGRVDSVSWRHPLRFIRSVRAKRALLKRYGVDLVHMNEPGWNSDLVLAARLSGIPVVLHLHNPVTVSNRNLNYVAASRIFVCSAAQAREIGNFDRVKDRCVVLYNAVDIGLFAGGRPIRESIGLSKDDRVIGTIAQIKHGKGIDLFLDTAERLLTGGNEVKLVIVGPKGVAEDDYFRACIDRIERSPLQGNVIYLGSRVDVPDLLASFDIFFLPTRAETFGMVVIEAMAAGVPVVVSHVGGIPEIVTGADVGRTVRDLDPDAYATAIEELLQMGDALKALGERGRESLAGRFDIAHVGATLGAVYKQLAMQRQ